MVRELTVGKWPLENAGKIATRSCCAAQGAQPSVPDALEGWNGGVG